jgi:hypothetical protein
MAFLAECIAQSTPAAALSVAPIARSLGFRWPRVAHSTGLQPAYTREPACSCEIAATGDEADSRDKLDRMPLDFGDHIEKQILCGHRTFCAYH